MIRTSALQFARFASAHATDALAPLRTSAPSPSRTVAAASSGTPLLRPLTSSPRIGTRRMSKSSPSVARKWTEYARRGTLAKRIVSPPQIRRRGPTSSALQSVPSSTTTLAVTSPNPPVPPQRSTNSIACSTPRSALDSE